VANIRQRRSGAMSAVEAHGSMLDRRIILSSGTMQRPTRFLNWGGPVSDQAGRPAAPGPGPSVPRLFKFAGEPNGS
jgi:hypothetical protein